MTIEALTQQVKVKLINGQEVDVKIKQFLTLRERQAIMNAFFGDMKVGKGTKVENVEISATKMFDLMSAIAERVWADKNYTMDDVDGESLSEVIMARFESFLGNFGFKRENTNSDGNKPGQDK